MASKSAPDVLTLEEAAALLKLCTKTVVKKVKAGKIPGSQLGERGQWRFSRQALIALLEKTHGSRAA